MTNGTFSRLALLGLAAMASSAFAANNVSGQIRLDGDFPSPEYANGTKPSAPYQLDVTRARLHFAGDVASDWTYFVRLDLQPARDMKMNVYQAYASWHGMDNMHLHVGKTPGPFFSADEYYYKPYIGDNQDNGAIGVIKQKNGDAEGLNIDGSIGMVGYSLGAWKAASAKFKDGVITQLTSAPNKDAPALVNDTDAHNLRFGYGGRLALSPMNAQGAAFGVGLGFAKTPVSEKVAMKGKKAVAAAGAPSYLVTGFNEQTDYTVDASAVFSSLQVNAGYFHQTLNKGAQAGEEQSYAAANDVAPNQVPPAYSNQGFNVDGKAMGYYGEIGYVIMGNGYAYDASKAVVSGVNLNPGQGALEIVLRAGVNRYENASALLHSLYTKNAEGDPVLATYVNGKDISTNQYRLQETTLSAHANYYVNSHVVLKAQYANTTNKVDNFAGAFSAPASSITSKESAIEDGKDGIAVKKNNEFRIRAEYSF